MSNEELDKALGFLGPRLREMLSRLAKADRWDEVQELAWIIEAYARGRLKDQGDDAAIPRVPVTDLPTVHRVEKSRVRLVPGPAGETDSPPLRGSTDE